ncbi:unnamed protein product [Prorocentrum cordatum]|uniref:H(+)-exporting diphosphatase n=1 Tax=Prorocentrum cordatum TaxID=2364126 RepID=A0ABN9VGZ9_9DINO|nr:unnamed protein product [Polarella glacialis]
MPDLVVPTSARWHKAQGRLERPARSAHAEAPGSGRVAIQWITAAMASSAFPGGLLGSALRLLVFIAVGLAFGFLFERSHVYEPDAIRKQFMFQRNIMLKMFVGAVGGAALTFYV